MAVALVVRRVVVYDGVERQVGEVVELPPLRAAMAMAKHGHAFGFATQQPKTNLPIPKRPRRRKAAAQVEA